MQQWNHHNQIRLLQHRIQIFLKLFSGLSYSVLKPSPVPRGTQWIKSSCSGFNYKRASQASSSICFRTRTTSTSDLDELAVHCFEALVTFNQRRNTTMQHIAFQVELEKLVYSQLEKKNSNPHSDNLCIDSNTKQ